MAESSEQPRTFLVVGECGDGKSTLVNGLRDTSRGESAAAGKAARGVTKELRLFDCPPLGGRPLRLIDSPGVGDLDVPPARLVSLFEAALVGDGLAGDVTGLLVTVPVPDARVKLGASVVLALVRLGFEGADRWRSIGLVGTKADRAEDDDVRCFLDELVPLFFQDAPQQMGPHALAGLGDYSQLREMIEQMPHQRLHYRPPTAEALAAALAEAVGMDPGAFTDELKRERQAVAEQQRQLEALQQELQQRQELQQGQRLQMEAEVERQRLACENLERQAQQARDAAHRRQLELQLRTSQELLAHQQRQEQELLVTHQQELAALRGRAELGGPLVALARSIEHVAAMAGNAVYAAASGLV